MSYQIFRASCNSTIEEFIIISIFDQIPSKINFRSFDVWQFKDCF